jgi:hypothetical protein
MVRPKPNGTARIILNLSAPKGSSVNDGIDKDEFPATMSSTTAWLEVLYKAGRNCWICKTDWSAAYKHFAVTERDTDLQWFSWGGKYFKELALIFGGSSSAGIFDDGAKVVLDLVCRKAQFPKEFVCQHLDDVCAAAADSSDAVHRFDAAFMEVAEFVGVKLAPRDDPDKSFGPSKKGTVFGIYYNTTDWTWCMPEKKLSRLIADITEALGANTVHEKEVKKIAGKILHIKPLIPGGKFHIDQIMKWLADSNRMDQVTVQPLVRQQLQFWTVLLRACSGHTTIPYPFDKPPAWAINAYTDAAGGSATNPASGSGGAMDDWWYWYPWAKKLQHGILKHEGKKISRKLSALELIGPLIIVSTNVQQCRYHPVTVWVDNIGSVEIWRKGYSNHCTLSTTIAKAINTVATAIGCELFIRKITRCSNTGAKIADHLSKGRFKEARSAAAEAGTPLRMEPGRIPQQLLHWLANPVVDDCLGDKIVADIAREIPMLRYSC